MKKCIKCGLPETFETIEFNPDGVCNVCVQHTFKSENIDWAARKITFDNLIEQYRGKYEYDCIIPFSGGKDSTFTLYYLMKEYNLKPLVVQFNHGFMRPQLLKNNEKTFKTLGVDVISFTPNWKVVQRVMLEALIRKGDFCWHCHTGIFSYPMHIAIKYNTPLVLWGEPSTEYTAYYDYRDDEIEVVDEARFNRITNLGITAEDMRGMIEDDLNHYDARDFTPYTYPSTRDLKKLRYQSLCLGSFIPWDTKMQSQLIMDELGWEGDEVEGMPPKIYDYEKIECSMQGVRDYIKFLKRGYSRVTQMTVLDIRNGRMSKDEADKLIQRYEGKKPQSLKLFLEYVGITEEKFNQLVAKTVVAPFEPDFSKDEWNPKPHDYDQWYSAKS
ncbi:N-acetyl sugar amidotransferase [Candidatus Njordibacter sp. Uisw_056]|jgi:N-acetyl sugar amidotransferase|uniref:N-acetyl sugar amidotransferase n=1 Tax=Candidatus Njordibacter sp. Uisw_056 TaxID=3230973 RepID=UPI003D4571BB|tara:strand:+ start:2373 stop:3527 length:1155 start_codon:yes stop_codon:yes gene_type:complete